MAIVDKFEVTVSCNGMTLQEFPPTNDEVLEKTFDENDPDDVPADAGSTVVRYIEALPDQ